MSVLIVLQMRLIMQKTLQPDKLRVRLVSVTNPALPVQKEVKGEA